MRSFVSIATSAEFVPWTGYESVHRRRSNRDDGSARDAHQPRFSTWSSFTARIFPLTTISPPIPRRPISLDSRASSALPGTPSVNGLSGSLLNNNPNFTNSANGTGAANPFRFNRSQAYTADMSHSYGPEQEAYDHFAMDLFPKFTGAAGGTTILTPPAVTTKGEVMGYFDGNTVTAMWEYAQNFALNDNNYNTQFGPSTPGALNLISGQTNGIIATLNGPRATKLRMGQAVSRSSAICRPFDQHLLELNRIPGATEWNKRRRFTQQCGNLLGLVPGWVRSYGDQSERDHALQEEHGVANHGIIDRGRL